ncbi:MAG: arylsulfatase, partial [Actinomycetia bacterium]|nr:arylsulfatase [Actinomycetes bacterium]
IRRQFHHVVDLTPTILEAAGVDQPEVFRGRQQLPVAGTSMTYSFDSADAPSATQAQYFEMFGHRGIWADGWKAVTWHRRGKPFDEDTWELYHLDDDFSECNNLAEGHPEKLAELIELWWSEAERHGVLPLDDDVRGIVFRDRRAGTPHSGTTYRYLPPIARMPSDSAPAIGGRSWAMTATVDPNPEGGDGVLAAWGTANTGFSWYLHNDELVFDYNLFGTHHVARCPVSQPASGSVTPMVRLDRNEGGALITVSYDGSAEATVQIPFVLRMIGMSGFDIGRDAGSQVGLDYEGPYPFDGTYHSLDVEITDDLTVEEIFRQDQERIRQEMAQQ